MSNQFPEAFVPSVPLTLEIPTKDNGKRELHFKVTFDFNAMALAEEKLGVSMLTLSPKVWVDMKTRTVAVLVWAGIQKTSPDYAGDEGLDAIGSFLYGANVGPAIKAVNEAYIVVQTPAVQKFIRDMAKKAEERQAGTSPNVPTAEEAGPIPVESEAHT